MRILSRQEAIHDLREAILDLTDEKHSACNVVGRLGIFCRGLRGLDDSELRARYNWLVGRQKPCDRADLEDLANRWQLARQAATDFDLACDVQTQERDTCLGWNTFSNNELEVFYFELWLERVRIE
jgi:hypothetical protein